MMRQIGHELHRTTSALTPFSTKDSIDVLDICMAPGGFCAAVRDVHPSASICAITLPAAQNGHDILLRGWNKDARLHVLCLDVTMLATEMGAPQIAPNHPDAANFVFSQPFSNRRFDLIFCDGQVLRRHQRAEYRERREAWRLLTSQLVVALQRVREGGTLVLLLHKLDAWDTVFLLHTLSKFSTLQLFKPTKKHAIRSSFYAVAKGIQPQDSKLLAAIETWKKGWSIATFGTEEEYTSTRHGHDIEVKQVLEDFGEDLIRLGEPIWAIQQVALTKAPFLK